MNPITITDLRSNLSSHLEKVKEQNKPLVFWERHKREFLITPYPDTREDIDLIEYSSAIENKAIEKDYYKWLQNSMQEWFSDEHDDLFE